MRCDVKSTVQSPKTLQTSLCRPWMARASIPWGAAGRMAAVIGLLTLAQPTEASATVTLADYCAYVADYVQGEPLFDLTGDGVVNLIDVKFFAIDAGVEPNACLFGDLNFDGVVDSDDIQTFNQFLSGMGALSPLQFFHADFDLDGDVDSVDRDIIQLTAIDLSSPEPTLQFANPGDVNENAVVNVIDLVLLSDLVANGGETDAQFCAGDINNDFVLNILDLVALQNMLVR